MSSTAGQAPFTPPTVEELAALFPQLEISQLIGKGGMGAVYKARQVELDRVVALKILPPGIDQEASFAERFAREAKALAKLSHPGIVTLYEFGRADGLFYFLMEFVDGVNLRRVLQGGRVSPREALAIVPQICDALQYAHDQGIVHRDIKPENILLDRRGRVKVADFGLAKLVGPEGASRSGATLSSTDGGAVEARGERSLTDAGKVMGTPQYMAPEQAEHPGDVDHRADIYALGLVFYQMLTGELPGKRLEPPSKKVQIDVRLDEIVLRALEKDPELRYQQASVLKTQLETIAMSPEESRGYNPKALAKDLSVKPWRVTWLVLLMGFICLVVVICFLPRKRSREAPPTDERSRILAKWGGFQEIRDRETLRWNVNGLHILQASFTPAPDQTNALNETAFNFINAFSIAKSYEAYLKFAMPLTNGSFDTNIIGFRLSRLKYIHYRNAAILRPDVDAELIVRLWWQMWAKGGIVPTISFHELKADNIKAVNWEMSGWLLLESKGLTNLTGLMRTEDNLGVFEQRHYFNFSPAPKDLLVRTGRVQYAALRILFSNGDDPPMPAYVLYYWVPDYSAWLPLSIGMPYSSSRRHDFLF